MNEPDENREASSTPTFADAVQQNLDRLNVKPRCVGCSCIGWANFDILPVPTVTPTLAQNLVMYCVVIVCLKCGLKTERNLNVLGMPVTFEQRRVLTPTEIAGQQPKPPMIIQP